MENIDKTKSNKDKMSEAEAVFCIFMAVIYADGKMSDAEIDEFNNDFNRIKLFKNLSITELFRKFQNLFKEHDYNPEKIVEIACPLVSTDNRLPVFIYCCDFIFTDDVEKQYEMMLLQAIMDGLTLDEKIADNAIKFIKRKKQL